MNLPGKEVLAAAETAAAMADAMAGGLDVERTAAEDNSRKAFRICADARILRWKRSWLWLVGPRRIRMSIYIVFIVLRRCLSAPGGVWLRGVGEFGLSARRGLVCWIIKALRS